MFIKMMNFIMDENNVTEVLKIINKHHKNPIVKNCGWADDVNKWFIMGYISVKRYNMIINELRKNFKLEEKECRRIYLTKIES